MRQPTPFGNRAMVRGALPQAALCRGRTRAGCNGAEIVS